MNWIKARKAIPCLLLVASMVTWPARADDPAPDALVKSTGEEVLAAISQTSDPQKLVQVADSKVSPHFDFTRMTQLAVGKSWREATPEQRQALEKEFHELLVRTYANAMAAGAKNKMALKVKPLQPAPDPNEAVVNTEVTQAGGPPVAINYQLEKTSAGWKVFDVQVDNISLVTNYRQMFTEEISRSRIDGLIKVLAEKNKSLAENKRNANPS